MNTYTSTEELNAALRKDKQTTKIAEYTHDDAKVASAFFQVDSDYSLESLTVTDVNGNTFKYVLHEINMDGIISELEKGIVLRFDDGGEDFTLYRFKDTDAVIWHGDKYETKIIPGADEQIEWVVQDAHEWSSYLQGKEPLLRLDGSYNSEVVPDDIEYPDVLEALLEEFGVEFVKINDGIFADVTGDQLEAMRQCSLAFNHIKQEGFSFKVTPVSIGDTDEEYVHTNNYGRYIGKKLESLGFERVVDNSHRRGYTFIKWVGGLVTFSHRSIEEKPESNVLTFKMKDLKEV